MKQNGNSVIKRRYLLFIPALILLAGSIFFYSCNKPKVYKVGILTSFSPLNAIADGFKAKMTELGYVEGENIIYDFQAKDNDPEGERQAVRDFIAEKFDLILTFPTQSSVIAVEETKNSKTPVLITYANVEETLPVESIAHPGGNFTGVRFPGPDNVVKFLDIFLQIKPTAKTVWVTYDEDYPNTSVMLNVLLPYARSKGVTIMENPGKTGADVQKALDALLPGDAYKNVDAIMLLPEALSLSPDGFGAIITFGNAHNIPVLAGVLPMMEAGVLFCLLPDENEVGKMAAPIADKILKGTDPGTIPIVSSENVMGFNYKKATELGLTIPEGLLRQAVQILK